MARFDNAIATARNELAALAQHIPENAPPEFEGFLDLHLMILGDSTLSEAPKEIIANQRSNAEWALTQQAEDAARASSTASRTRTCASARPTSCRWSSGCSRR